MGTYLDNIYAGNGWAYWDSRYELNRVGHFPSTVESAAVKVQKWTYTIAQSKVAMSSDHKVFFLSAIEINKHTQGYVAQTYFRPDRALLTQEGVGKNHNEPYLYYAEDSNKDFGVTGDCLLRTANALGGTAGEKPYVRSHVNGSAIAIDTGATPRNLPWVPAFCF